MHAICANEITCAAARCHQPGTVAVGCGPTHREEQAEDGRTKHIEVPPVVLEFCERHAPKADDG